MHRTRRTHGALAALFCVAFAGAAAAQPAPQAPSEQLLEQAREQYRAGVAAFRARRFAEAALAFETSFRIRPHPTTLYNAAEARLRAGDRAGAVEQLQTLLGMTNPAPSAEDVDRARALGREAGVQNLAPRGAGSSNSSNSSSNNSSNSGGSASASTPCARCPNCPPSAPCPSCPPSSSAGGSASSAIVPVGLAVGGAVLIGAGMYFYAVALADAATYANANAPDSLRIQLRSQGEVFRWVGLVGLLGGLAMEAVAVVVGVQPPPRANQAALRAPRSAPRSARLDVGPGALFLSGQF